MKDRVIGDEIELTVPGKGDDWPEVEEKFNELLKDVEKENIGIIFGKLKDVKYDLTDFCWHASSRVIGIQKGIIA